MMPMSTQLVDVPLAVRRRQLRRQRRFMAVREWIGLVVVGIAGVWFAAFATVAVVAR